MPCLGTSRLLRAPPPPLHTGEATWGRTLHCLAQVLQCLTGYARVQVDSLWPFRTQRASAPAAPWLRTQRAKISGNEAEKAIVAAQGQGLGGVSHVL